MEGDKGRSGSSMGKIFGNGDSKQNKEKNGGGKKLMDH